MGTLSNVTSAASRAIWGDQTSQPADEPESGRPGAGTKIDPYDAGNAAEQSYSTSGDNTTSTKEPLVSGSNESSGLSEPTAGNSDTSTLPTESTNQNAPGTAQASGGPITPHHDQDKTGVTDLHSTDATHSSKPTSNANESSVADSGQSKAPVGGFGAAEPSVSADPASGAQSTEDQQGAQRPTEEPSGKQTDAIKESKSKDEDALDEDKLEDGVDDGAPKPNKDPNDHSGEPLGTVDHSGKSDAKADGNSDEGHKEGGGPLGGEKSKEQGTGEKWIKTSGVEADGGNFDAAQAGAAKEADRLLEQKGIHRSGDNTGAPETGDGANDSSVDPGKPSVGQKIKEKLHIGKKDS